MERHHQQHRGRYVPARTNGGWKAAAATILLAIVCIIGATIVHMQTYKPPTDPSWRAAGSGSAGAAH